MIKQHFYSLIITTVCTVIVSLIILLNARKKQVHLRYVCYISAIGLWSLFQAFGISSRDPIESKDCWSISHIGVILIPVFFSSFVLKLGHFISFKFQKTFRVFVLIYASIALGLHILGNLFSGVKQVGLYTYVVRPSVIYTSFLITWSTIITISLLMLSKCYLKESDTSRKRQLAYFTFSMVIAYCGGVTNYLPVYNIYTPTLNTFGTYLVAIHIVIAGYAILAKGLMGVDLILKRTFVYTFFILVISIVYMGLTYFAHLVLLKTYSYQHTALINAVIFIIVASTFKPVELLIKKFLDYYFFKGTIDQISSQKEHLESELERTHRLKSVGILAAGMAHEIRNPIQSLRTFGEHLEKNYNDPEFRSKFEKLLIQETDRIKNLTSDLLDFSKPKEPKKVKTNLNELINQTLSLLESDLIGDMIQIKRNLPEDPIYKEIDPEQIKQALLNLILNAKDAMKHSTEKILTISLVAEPQSQKIGASLQFSEKHENQRLAPIFISIKDTGCGIPEDKIPHLFDPFYTDKKEGTGLGLAITHSIIQRHGGGIEVRSGATGCVIKLAIL